MSTNCIFILGGSRSGKSTFAQKLAHELGKSVLFVATAEAGDEEMARRIAQHRKNRPKGWRTLEVTRNIGRQIEKNAGNAEVIIIDCLTLLVSNLLMTLMPSTDSTCHSERSEESGNSTAASGKLRVTTRNASLEEEYDNRKASRVVRAELKGLLKCLDTVDATFIIVSNEVGLGLVPPYPLGRVYRDLLGEVNQAVAQHAGEVYFMAAGIPITIKSSQ